MISIVEVLKLDKNRASLAFRKPTKTKADYDSQAARKVDSYRKISQRLVDKADVEGKPWGSRKMK